MREGEPHFEEESQVYEASDAKEPILEKETPPKGQGRQNEKELKWKGAEQNLEKFCGIEKRIQDTVAGLNVFGIETVNSCEGHNNRGRIAPWVSIELWESKPQERYAGQKEFEQEVYEKLGVTQLNKNYTDYLREFDSKRAEILGPGRVEPDSEQISRQISKTRIEIEKKYGITPKVTKKWMETGMQADKEVGGAEKDGHLQETEKYKKWKAENDAMKNKAQQLLDDFYRNRKVQESARVLIDQDGTDSWCIHNGGKDYYDVTRKGDEIPDADKKHYQKVLDGKNSKKEQRDIKRRVGNYRAEFQDFAAFLKEKYFASR